MQPFGIYRSRSVITTTATKVRRYAATNHLQDTIYQNHDRQFKEAHLRASSTKPNFGQYQKAQIMRFATHDFVHDFCKGVP